MAAIIYTPSATTTTITTKAMPITATDRFTTLARQINATANTTMSPDLTLSCQFSREFKTVFCYLLLSVGIISILENLMFCHAVYSRRGLHKLSMALIVSLSISDIIISIFIPSIEFVFTLTFPNWPLKSFGTNIYNSMWAFSIVSPFCTLTAITFERYIAITQKKLYDKMYTPCTIGCTIGLIWIYSCAWIIITAYTLKPIHKSRRYRWNVNHELYYIFIGLHVLIPMCIIPVLYSLIIRHVKRSRKDLASLTTSFIHNAKSSEINLTKTMARVVVALFGIWLPVLIVEFVYTKLYSDCIIKKLDLVSVVLASSSCVLNPILYSYKNTEIRKYLKDRKKLVYGIFCTQN